jgi:hypothetical protein
MEAYEPIPAEAVGEVISGGSEIIDQLTPEWLELCSKPCNDYLPFCRPEWVKAYFEKQENSKFQVLVVKKQNELTGLLPMIQQKKRISRLPIRILRGPSEWLLWPTDILIASDADRASVAKNVWNIIRNQGEWDVIEFPVVPKGGVAEDVLKAAVTEGYDVHRWEHMHSPYIRLANDISEKPSVPLVRSSKLRRNLRKIIKKLEAEGGLKVHHFDRADPGMLHRFYELEASGWKGQQGSAILSTAKEINFWNTIAAGAAKNHYLSVTALEHKGNIVAISLGFAYRNQLFGMKLGYDNQLKAYSMGQLLVWAELEHCCRCSLSEFHLMGLRSNWKVQWTDLLKPHAMCYIFRKGFYGFATKQVILRNIRWNQKVFATKSEQLES